MRFCDKLAKLRKNNNLSQEQLADRLGVSRQAVSKWELGSSHPDMDKLIQICKTLDCTLEELMDDNVIGNKDNFNNKSNLSTYFNDFLNFITRVSNMFSSMKFKEKIKCIIEMSFVILFLFLIGMMILSVVNSITIDLLSIFPYDLEYYVGNILEQFYIIGLIILGTIIAIHIFKIRYLDYFITIEDVEAKEKVIEKPIEEESVIEKDIINEKEKDKEKIIIRDPKHISFSFFKMLGKMISFLTKSFCIILLIPVLLLFLLSIIGSIILMCHILYGKLFLFLTIVGLGIIAILFLIIKIIFDFLFNAKTPYKRTFITFMISLCIIGVGSGLTLVSLTDYKQKNDYDDLERNVYTEYFDLTGNPYIYSYCDIEYIVDNSLTNAKVEILALDGVNYKIYEGRYDSEGNKITNYDIYVSNVDYSEIYEYFIKDLKNKIFRTYSNNSELLKIKVYMSEENLARMKSNNYVY